MGAQKNPLNKFMIGSNYINYEGIKDNQLIVLAQTDRQTDGHTDGRTRITYPQRVQLPHQSPRLSMPVVN